MLIPWRGLEPARRLSPPGWPAMLSSSQLHDLSTHRFSDHHALNPFSLRSQCARLFDFVFALVVDASKSAPMPDMGEYRLHDARLGAELVVHDGAGQAAETAQHPIRTRASECCIERSAPR